MAHGGANQRETVDACHIGVATLTSVLSGMEVKSPIERRRTDGDRHPFYIYPTNNGKEMGQKVTEAFSRLEEDTFRDIPSERTQEFMELSRGPYLRI